jgi:hypothetical protein
MLAIMEIVEAQRDVRTTFMGGFAGQLVTSGVWFLSAASFTWFSFRTAVMVLGSLRHITSTSGSGSRAEMQARFYSFFLT